MLTKTKNEKNSSRVLASVLSVVLILSMMPIGAVLTAFAQGVTSFTVTLSGYDKDAQVTLTNASEITDDSSVAAVNGVATFENFIDDEKTYNLTVTNLVGYADYQKDNIILASGQMSYDVTDLVELDKVTISGVVSDENGQPYNNATVGFSAYSGKLTGNTTANSSGEYSFEAYKGQDYSVTATADEPKYEVASTSVTNPTADITDANIQLNVKQFLINTTAGANGIITAPETLGYGESKTVAATANDGYRISSFKVDGTEQNAAIGEITYSYSFEDITAAHTVTATYVRKTYSIAFTISENGEVKYNDGSDHVVTGGSVSFNESTDPAAPTKVTVNATPNTNYRVSSVTVDGTQPETFTANDKSYSKEFTMTSDHTFVVEFVLNTYSVTVNSFENGTASSDLSKVNYNGTAIVTINPADGYNIESVTVNGVGANYTINSDETTYTLEIKNIVADTTVEVECSEIPTVSFENFSFNNNDAVRTDDSDAAVVKYVYANDGTVTFQTEKDGIRINGNKSTGKAYRTKTWVINKSTLVTDIEVFYENKWHSVELSKNIQIIIDKTAPVLSDISEMSWSSTEQNTISGNVTDNVPVDVDNPSSGLQYVVWSNTELNDSQIKSESVNKADIVNCKYSIVISGEQHNEYFVYAVDYAGNVSQAKKFTAKIDTTAPTITNFEITKIDGSPLDKVLNFLTFGMFFNDKVNVTVTAADVTSKPKSITLYYGDKSLTENVDAEMKCTFTLPVEDIATGAETVYLNSVLSAKATDYAGNITETAVSPSQVNSDVKNDKLMVESVKPTVNATWADPVANMNEATKDSNQWYADDVEFTVIASDNDAGLRNVTISINGTELVNENLYSAELHSKEYKVNTKNATINSDGSYVLLVKATDNSGNISDDYTRTIYKDVTKPGVSGFHIKKVHDSALDKVINFLTFGIFCNDEVEVTVTANDDQATSGVKEITLLVDGGAYATKSVSADNNCVFTIPTSEITSEQLVLDKTLSAKSTDNVGNTTVIEVYPTEVNSNIKNSGLMIETVRPLIDVTFADPASNKNAATKDENDWYNGDVAFTVKASDEHSGIAKVEVSINDTALSVDKNNKSISEDFATRSSKTTKETFVVNTDQVAIAADGSYTLKVTVTDNAGNVSIPYTKTVFKDIENPVIVGFDFAATEYVEGSETTATVEKTDYGFYFKADTNVTITARDSVPTAGIKSITYYTVDVNSGKSEEKTVLVNANNQITFTVPANFKGQIYAKATDNVDNVTVNFVNPNSAIVENAVKHEEESHIAFDKAETTYKANDNTELYANDVPVIITVTDTYSGIRSIEWSVVAPYDVDNNQSGKVVLNNDKSISAVSDTDWEQTKTEVNLVTEMKKTVTVKNNSNDIVIKVTMTDRAGNTSVQEIDFSIDKTKPVIEVSYDNNTPDQDFTDFYKADRTATVKVTERNFKAQDIVYAITNTDGVIPVLSDWAEHKNATNPDESYYTATILYHADGDYTFDISYADLAKNAADTFAQHKFTMDQTLPTINVSYDNTTALNGNYYAADRTATITINEHNFETGRIVVTGTATDNGATAVFPTTSEWSTNGDIHVATIHYASDAKYSFDIAYTDKAGNDSADYAVEEFFVDKTAPTLVITGVADKSANNGDIIPVISFSDTNYNANGITVGLSGINKGTTKVNGAYSDITNGQTFTFVNFEKTKENDDIYTMTAKVVDFAGNETTQTITFSVNRFGSVYTFDDTLTSIEGKYVKNEVDVILTETNVDVLKHDTIKLKITKNGSSSDLKEGTDYSVAESGGNGQWSQYKYTVNKGLFSNDGRYTVTLYSEDAAGNVNENIDETKEAEISFGVDKTAPVIAPTDFESEKQYPVESKTVSAEIKDNLVLEGVKIYLNDKEIEYKVDGQTYTFDIPESNSKQNVRFVATDAAANEYELPVENFLVSTNIFVRWFNNTPLFIGSIIAVAVLGIGISALAIFGKKKKKN